jgi:hypothetical protein
VFICFLSFKKEKAFDGKSFLDWSKFSVNQWVTNIDLEVYDRLDMEAGWGCEKFIQDSAKKAPQRPR